MTGSAENADPVFLLFSFCQHSFRPWL